MVRRSRNRAELVWLLIRAANSLTTSPVTSITTNVSTYCVSVTANVQYGGMKNKSNAATPSSVAKTDALQKSVNSATLLVQATRQSVKGGERTNLDVLNAQQQQVAAKRDLAQARYNYLISFLKLRVAAGTLNIDDLRTVAGYFSAAN